MRRCEVLLRIAGRAGLTLGAFLLVIGGPEVSAQSVGERCDRAVRVLVTTTHQVAEVEFVAASCRKQAPAALAAAWERLADGGPAANEALVQASGRHGGPRLHDALIRAAANPAAPTEIRLGALRVLVAELVPHASVSAEWLESAAPGDGLPRSSHVVDAAESPRVRTLARRDLPTLLDRLAASELDAPVRRAAVVLRQAIVLHDPTLARTLEGASAFRAEAGCGDIVRLTTTADVSLPYRVRVEGTGFDRVIWLKPAPPAAPSNITLGLPAGTVTVSVADRTVATLSSRPGPCP